MVVLEAKNIDRSAGHHTYLIVLGFGLSTRKNKPIQKN